MQSEEVRRRRIEELKETFKAGPGPANSAVSGLPRANNRVAGTIPTVSGATKTVQCPECLQEAQVPVAADSWTCEICGAQFKI